ncbi:MAG: tRNA 4-thiouridine(8) synthase ThiI [Candidatus Altiarchaeota archaeon]|nr:tRNA 4-thiouridine(8) synthase ThiI [Candidatus Altiarchaeota archaeon]
MYDTVLVRYGEIFLKSEHVKRQFENRLIENIRLILKRKNLEGEIIRRRHRILIQTKDAESVSESLSKVFGIVSTSPAIETKADMAVITEKGLGLAKQVIAEGERFAIRATRTGKHDFSSKDIENVVGRRISESINASVDLSNPEKTISIEVSDEKAFIFDKKNTAVGGLPYKTQGKVVSLISTGIDSPVAAWMMMHRGCEIIALHLGKDDGIEDILNALEEFTAQEIMLYQVDHEKMLKDISVHAGKHACIVCKRTMLRIAKRVCRTEKAHGVVMGDNLGQVASQTLENLEVISGVTSPIYRPLIGMDKEEIIKRAKDIGTYELARKKRCHFVPKKPATRADIGEIEALEREIGVEKMVEELKLECKKG